MTSSRQSHSSVIKLNKKILRNVSDCDLKPDKTVTLRNPSCHVISSKVTLVGSSGVGKTSLALRFCRGEAGHNPKPTVAADWLHQTVTVHNRTVNLQIWDTAGQERYLAVVPNFIRDSSGVLLVYDVTDLKSFAAKTMWLSMVRKAVPNAVVFLLANKVDKPSQRVVTTEEGEEFASENNLPYAETSAITGLNVDSVFYDLAEQIVCSGVVPDTDHIDTFQLTDDDQPQRKCSC